MTADCAKLAGDLHFGAPRDRVGGDVSFFWFDGHLFEDYQPEVLRGPVVPRHKADNTFERVEVVVSDARFPTTCFLELDDEFHASVLWVVDLGGSYAAVTVSPRAPFSALRDARWMVRALTDATTLAA